MYQKVLCPFCVKYEKCDKPCNGQWFMPIANIMPNYPNGSTSEWNLEWKATRIIIYWRDIFRCYICHKGLIHNWHVHHLRRKEFGGSNHPRNLVLMSEECHHTSYANVTEKQQIKQKVKETNDAYWSKMGIIDK